MASSKDAVLLQVDGHEVRVSNPEKPYFAERGIRKIDVVEYFVAVGGGILHALRDRPTTLERWPGGVFEGARLSTRMDNTGDAFYQKRVPKNAPEWVPTAHITFPSGRTADEIAPDSVAVVAWCANLGTLTFHPWPVSKGDVESPDQIRIDLDPQPGTDFSDAVWVADRKSTRLNSSYANISYAVFCLKKKKPTNERPTPCFNNVLMGALNGWIVYLYRQTPNRLINTGNNTTPQHLT